MYDVIFGHHGEDKNISFGGQKLSYRVETLYTWLKTASSTTYILFFLKILKILDFVIIFLKTSDFLKFLGSKKAKFKNPR